jgi:starch phosphorylase
VQATLRAGYRPRDYYERDGELKEVLDLIRSGFFSPDHPDEFAPMIDRLLERDEYLLLADFRAYVDCQAEVGTAFGDHNEWHRRAILNIAKMGYFSSDRTIKEYAADIWKAAPLKW